MLGVNHLSYRCPDYVKARDWYASVLGMQIAPGRETEKRANLMFGPEPGKGGSYVAIRCGGRDASRGQRRARAAAARKTGRQVPC